MSQGQKSRKKHWRSRKTNLCSCGKRLRSVRNMKGHVDAKGHDWLVVGHGGKYHGGKTI